MDVEQGDDEVCVGGVDLHVSAVSLLGRKIARVTHRSNETRCQPDVLC